MCKRFLLVLILLVALLLVGCSPTTTVPIDGEPIGSEPTPYAIHRLNEAGVLEVVTYLTEEDADVAALISLVSDFVGKWTTADYQDLKLEEYLPFFTPQLAAFWQEQIASEEQFHQIHELSYELVELTINSVMLADEETVFVETVPAQLRDEWPGSEAVVKLTVEYEFLSAKNLPFAAGQVYEQDLTIFLLRGSDGWLIRAVGYSVERRKE